MSTAVHYDETADFSRFETYYPVRPELKGGPEARRRQVLFNKHVFDEVRKIMEAKGFRQADSPKDADLLVHFYALVRNERHYVPAAYRVGRWGRRRVVHPGRMANVKKGTLVIDIVDRFRKELVWQGVGKGTLDKADPGKDLIEAVNKVLKDFPPDVS